MFGSRSGVANRASHRNSSNCGTSAGDEVKSVDAAGNVDCMHYDALHRLTTTLQLDDTGVPEKDYIYDQGWNGMGRAWMTCTRWAPGGNPCS